MPSRALLAALTVAFALIVSVSLLRADELGEIDRLVSQGSLPQALERTNAFLADRPKDPQGRFLKGIILTELSKPQEAVQVFLALTEDFPELPEPYNNLAVLYASQGQYDKARVALELAIHTHPSYATAHENLGDIYAKLASRAYDKALALDKTNAAAQSKLALIKDLFGGRTTKASLARVDAPKLEPAKAAAPAKPAQIATAETAPPKPAQIATAETAPPKPAQIATAETAPPKPAPEAAKPAPAAQPATPAPEPPPQPGSQAASPPPVAVKPVESAPAKPAVAEPSIPENTAAKADVAIATPSKPPAASASAPSTRTVIRLDASDAIEVVELWAKAWSTKDVRRYLSHYAPNFEVPGNGSRERWEENRRARITKPGAISVAVSDTKVDFLDEKNALVTFTQTYRSRNLDSVNLKTVKLVRVGKRWLIQQERVIN